MKIVILDGYTLNPGDLSWDALNSLGDVVIYDRTPTDQIVGRCLGANIILTNKTPLDEATLNQLSDLKYIGVLATGYNIVNTDVCKQKGVIVSNVPGYGTGAVAQFVFALLLELCLHVQKHSDAVIDGKWARSADFCFWDYPLIELAGKTLGIIGFGTIGQKVADIAAAFDMNVIASSRTQTDQSHRENFKWVSLDELLQQSDMISIHCPLTPETQSLINAANLKKMKPSAFLINTSRGPIINDADLADALKNDIIAGAGIDVLSKEPPPADNPIFTAKNCIITPHIAWAAKEARARLMNTVVSNLEAFMNGVPVNVVNK
ncbi:MAG: D-isomer specific 2-hydroxyacid dehydrogenase NAD-binding protein [Mucilaginibacter sp.]|uniref:D-2-hydroxyacid dehydrogenase n=1 Tax=Mucilaginibacter sp. TaxID=1882438 RepID=UPI00261F1BE3|nr:D-2-hydroxyacid dehydrogenase [Mucilaginibacter sp.]MDB5002773.1 D-isomer specific 2-hydroxyacid dehydrogenase NAD-binding protein [Mucilaginibacter sp.]